MFLRLTRHVDLNEYRDSPSLAFRPSLEFLNQWEAIDRLNHGEELHHVANFVRLQIADEVELGFRGKRICPELLQCLLHTVLTKGTQTEIVRKLYCRSRHTFRHRHNFHGGRITASSLSSLCDSASYLFQIRGQTVSLDHPYPTCLQEVR